MEWDREPENKLTHLWSINLQQRMQEYTMQKTRQLHVKELEHSFNTIYKISSKLVKDLNIKQDTIELLKEKTEQSLR